MSQATLRSQTSCQSFSLTNLLLLMGGTGGGAALFILASPLLSRFYLPAAFGMLTVYVSILSILTTICSLRYEVAIPLPEDDDVAANLLVASLASVFGCALLVTGAVLLGSNAIAGWSGTPMLAPYLLFLPLGLVGAGVTQALGYWALRKERFAVMARTRVGQAIGTVVPQVGFALLQPTSPGLILGDTLGRFSGVFSLLSYARKDVPWQSVSIAGIRSSARQYLKFPAFNAPASLLTVLSTQLPTLILAHAYGAQAAGWFGLTSRTLQAPATLLGQAVAQTFFAKAATLRRHEDQLRQLTEQTATRLFAVGVPIFGLLILNGPHLFSLAFGNRWERSGQYAQWLAPWYLLWLIANPLSNLLAVREWQSTTLFYSAIECLIKLGALAVGVRFGSDLLAVQVLAVSSGALALLTINRFFQAAYSSCFRIQRQAYAVVALAIVIFALVGAVISGPQTGKLVLRIFVSCTLYSALAWKGRRWLIL